ncbi:MAG: hypothetical protein FWH05_04815 [Oscillospiraceae bacterium]|nr:hypothetical protein [Oscillospiraceae bacterium]
MKKIRVALISVVVIIAVVIAPSAFVGVYNDNNPVLFLYDGPNPASNVEVWLNGGKRDIPIGVSVDSKIKQLTLYERFEGQMYDITASRQVKWIAMPLPIGHGVGSIQPPSDFKSARSENAAVTVSRGRVSARTEGSAVVMALKANNDGQLAAYQICVVNVRVGPSKFALTDHEKKPLKNFSVGVGETKDVYMTATANNSPVDFSEIYQFSFEKDGFNFASFGHRGDRFSLPHSMLEGTPIPIRGRDLANGKPARVSVLVTALNSGRTFKFNVTVDNPVVETTSTYVRVNMDYSRFDNTTRFLDSHMITSLVASSADYYRSGSGFNLPITDKAKVVVTDVEPTVQNMTDARGNFRLQGRTTTGLTAKLDTSNNLTLSLKRATQSMESTRTYVVVSYNDRINNNRLVGSVVFEVTINGVFVPPR